MRVNAIVAALATLIVSIAPALSLESTMTVSSPLTPDELWKKVGDFCGLAAWSPAIESCFLSEDGKQRTTLRRSGPPSRISGIVWNSINRPPINRARRFEGFSTART
jgi:Polyketide cyclase / dehydrase and lipid transport